MRKHNKPSKKLNLDTTTIRELAVDSTAHVVGARQSGFACGQTDTCGASVCKRCPQ